MTAAARPSWREEYGGRWQVELGVLALVLGAAAAFSPLGDPDLPIHLALGEWIVRHGTVPRVEPFAWTRAGDSFYAYSWLPEVAFYSAYRAAGVMGLRILQGLSIIGVVGAMLALARMARWSVWTAILLAGLQALLATTIAPYLRPHVILLMAVPLAWGCAIRLLESGRPWRWASGILALSALAANSHLLFVLTAAPWLLLALRWPGAGRAAWLAGATLAGWLLTPYALEWPAVFALNFNDNLLFTYPTPITELTPGVQAAVSGRGALLALAVALGALPWAARGLTRRERIVWGLAWLAGLFAFALAARAIFIWWAVVLPLVAAVIEPIARIPRRRTILAAQRIAVAALVFLLALSRVRVAGAAWADDTGASRWIPMRAAPWVDPAAEWLACRMNVAASGRALTSFGFGTYLTWRLPALSYSIDGRNIFPDSVAAAESYVLASRGPAPLGPWRTADLAMVPLTREVAAVLDTAAGWRRAAVVADARAESDSAALWVRESWWRQVSSRGLPDSAARLRPGREGVVAACR